MELISMTDFVLEQNEKLRKDIHDNYNKLLIPQCCDRIFNYANFLKKPLKLSYFIACDENDVPLEEPKRWKDYLDFPESFDGNKEWYELYAYQEAKQRVLFEGFEISFEDGVILPFLGKYPIGFFDIDNEWVLSDQFKTIEDLVNLKPKLTETAKKEIGL